MARVRAGYVDVTITVPDDWLGRIDQIAEAQDRTRPQQLRRWIRRILEDTERQDEDAAPEA